MQLDLPHVLMPGSLLHGSTLQCRQASRTFSVRAPRAVLHSLHDFDGTMTPRGWLDACRKRRWDIQAAEGLLRMLIAEDVLVCVHDMPRQLWSHALNPRLLGAPPSPARLQDMLESAQKRLAGLPGADAITLDSGDLADDVHGLLRKRVSDRTFGEDPLSPQVVTAVLWAAVGVVRGDDRLRTVTPSAGALYPLRHYYLNLRATGVLKEGAYALSSGDNARVHYSPLGTDISALQAAFSSPDLLDRAQGVLVIAAAFSDSARKYGSRALSYVPLEAGHAAQNALLAAAACNCHAVEIGGFIEQDLSALLRCGDGIVPLTTVILGSPGTRRTKDDEAEFEWVDAKNADGERTFFLCRARQDPTHPWSWGRDADPARARLKARMESREREALSRPTGLVRARLRDLPNAIDPRDVLRYAPAQYRRASFPYSPFVPQREYLWKAALNVLEDSPCFMLADLVYLEQGLAAHSRPPFYTSANTSGAAAHTCYAAALENAVLELIERDAFMRLWLGLPAIAVQEDGLPATLQTRLRRLRDAGLRVVIRDIGHSYCHVAFCFAQSTTHHFTRVSSCAGYDLESAIDRALMELEAQVHVSLHNLDAPPMRATQVREAADHAILYSQKATFRRADALAAQVAGSRTQRSLAHDWPTLTQQFRRDQHRLYAVDLSDGAPMGNPVVKAFIPGLIPIKFGAGNEPAGHPAYAALRLRAAGQRRGPAFPHPFN